MKKKISISIVMLSAICIGFAQLSMASPPYPTNCVEALEWDLAFCESEWPPWSHWYARCVDFAYEAYYNCT